jgi:Type IV secretion-system coupling protein DNA-binding domain
MAADAPVMPGTTVWRQLHWPRPLDAVQVLAVLRAWAADQHSPALILEARATEQGIGYLLGAPLAALLSAQYRLRAAVPELRSTELPRERTPVTGARRLRLSTFHRPLRSDEPEIVVRSVLGALGQVWGNELLVLQLVLGPRRIPLAVPNNSPASSVMPWWQVAWMGHGGTVDGEKRAALRAKVGDHGFAATLRLGVQAETAERRQELLIDLFSALRVSEAPGVKLGLAPDSVRKLNAAHSPWLWPLRLNVAELLSLTAWPVGDQPLPGQPPLHPKQLPPVDGTIGTERVIATATAPGLSGSLVVPTVAALHHLHILGPTGTGKSTLLINLICQDMAAGRAVVVVDPQGDLVSDVLARVPEQRRDDIIVLDPADTSAPVGLNPLLTRGRNPEVVADGLLAVFKGLYGDALGPRSQDILHACLLTLTRRDDASLVMLPLLLTNTGFRRSLTAGVRDPIALGPFWEWYESMSEGERQAAIAPIQNKLRQWLLRPSLRNVLGQRRPKLSISEVFAERRVLLVSLAQGQLGPEGAALLGSLVVAELWQATLERAALPASERHPVMVYLDEFSAFLHLPTDLADALARSRGMGVGYTLAHQFLAQLSPAMRASVLANTRSRVCFQLAPDDAGVIARSHGELSAEDCTSLDRYEVYASLFARGKVTPFASGRTLPAPVVTTAAAGQRARSRQRYGVAREMVELEFSDLLGTGGGHPAGSQAPLGKSRRRPA